MDVNFSSLNNFSFYTYSQKAQYGVAEKAAFSQSLSEIAEGDSENVNPAVNEDVQAVQVQQPADRVLNFDPNGYYFQATYGLSDKSEQGNNPDTSYRPRPVLVNSTNVAVNAFESPEKTTVTGTNYQKAE